ncbi:MAG: hypothetical protein N3A69_00995 [Leptospiraceae bacterium]|nr:hypothetical protein [Leptospiraceae bacterium]
MNVFLYSSKGELFSKISHFFENANASLTFSSILEIPKKEFSIYILNFDNLEIYKRFLENYKQLPSPSVSIGIFWEPIPSYIFDMVLISPNEFQIKRTLELAIELASFRSKYNLLPTETDSSEDSKFIIHRKSIYSLATSLSQGPGFGTAVTIVDMLEQTKIPKEEIYQVDKSLFDLLIQNNEHCRTTLDGLNQIVELLENQIQLEKISSQVLFEPVPSLLKELEPFFTEKNLKLTYKMEDLNFEVWANPKKILLVIEELLINAIKYSQPNTEVELKISASQFLSIQVKNQVHEQLALHLPNELKELAREPFIRFYPPGEETTKINKYGLGLGLTAIDYIVTQHKGEFILQEESKNFIVATINLPIVKEGKE